MPATPLTVDATAAALLRHSQQLIAQALDLVAAYEAPAAPAFADKAGPHLRHVIEHYEALLFSPQPEVVDYDSRARDRTLESSPALTRRRLLALQARLQGCAHAPDHALQLHGLCGLQGDARFVVTSSFQRELAFVASHAVHHYALLQAHGQQHGLPTPPGFGQAAASVAHARQTARFNTQAHLPTHTPTPTPTHTHPQEDTPCPPRRTTVAASS